MLHWEIRKAILPPSDRNSETKGRDGAGWGGIKRLPQKIGPINAMNMMLSGSFVNARKAYQIGLADVLSPLRTVENEAGSSLVMQHDDSFRQR